jgi:hypothetical protein
VSSTRPSEQAVLLAVGAHKVSVQCAAHVSYKGLLLVEGSAGQGLHTRGTKASRPPAHSWLSYDQPARVSGLSRHFRPQVPTSRSTLRTTTWTRR